MASKLKITQVRSAIRQTGRQKRTLEALGLRRMHHTVLHNDSPQIRGMVRRVSHLVKLEMASDAPSPARKKVAGAASSGKAAVVPSSPEKAGTDGAGEKPAAKKAPAKKSAARKAATKKTAAKKPAAKKTATKKTATKKTATKKTATRRLRPRRLRPRNRPRRRLHQRRPPGTKTTNSRVLPQTDHASPPTGVGALARIHDGSQ